MTPDKQSRWECSRRRGGTTHRRSRSGCAALQTLIFLRMISNNRRNMIHADSPRRGKLLRKYLAANANIILEINDFQYFTQTLRSFLSEVYQREKNLRQLTKLFKIPLKWKQPNCTRHLTKKIFRKLMLKYLCERLKSQNEQIYNKISKIAGQMPTKQMPQLDEKYFQDLGRQWLSHPLEQDWSQSNQGTSIMRLKKTSQTFVRRHEQEVFCWLVYMNFCEVLYKNQTLIKFEKGIEKSPDLVDQKNIRTYNEKSSAPEFQDEFIEKFFDELTQTQEETDFILALKVVTVYSLIPEELKLNEEGQLEKQEKPKEVKHQDMLLHLKSFLAVASKVKADQKTQNYILYFMKTVEVLIKKLGEDIKDQ